MIRRANSKSIPMDLTFEILARLPAKSTVKLRCMSKLWGSMLLRPYFTELFLTMSLARPPRLLFAVKRLDDVWCFFTSPQPQNPYETSSSSLVVSTGFKMKYPGDNTCIEFCGLASGLIYFCQTHDPVKEPVMICNPSTGQYTSIPLPLLKDGRKRRYVVGVDPVAKQFKVLSIDISLYGNEDEEEEEEEPNQILILEIGNNSWRKIACPLKHFPSGEGICINEVLYYFATQSDDTAMIVCFDVRSEKFKFIYKDKDSNFSRRVINYKGKLGVIALEHDDYEGRRRPLELCMWVIEDVRKPEWSKYFSYHWNNEVFVDYELSIVGMTTTSEIVLSMKDASTKLFYVFFLNPERKTLQRVEIQGFSPDEYSRVEVFTDHVEDLTFINA